MNGKGELIAKVRFQFFFCPQTYLAIYMLGYIKGGSTAFNVEKDGCGVPSAARVLLGPEGL